MSAFSLEEKNIWSLRDNGLLLTSGFRGTYKTKREKLKEWESKDQR